MLAQQETDRGAPAKQQWLVIIRGVPGVGKTEVAKALERLLPDNPVDLNLDDQPPKFPGFNSAYSARFVVGHLFSGSDRTANPRGWIDGFQRRGFRLLSVILDIGLEAGWTRLSNDPKRQGNTYWSRPLYEQRYRRFYNEAKFVNFEKAAGVTDSIRIDATVPSALTVAGRVFGELGARGAVP